MAWVKLDDGFPNGPEAWTAGSQAMALFIAGLCHVSRHKTDGLIPTGILPALCPGGRRRHYAAKLVEVELWNAHDLGWTLNGYWPNEPTDEQASMPPGALPADSTALPFDELTAWSRRRIVRSNARPKPPPYWVTGYSPRGLPAFQVSNRAWFEWYWARAVDIEKRREKVTASQRAAVIARDGYVCGICGNDVDPSNFHIDHIQPRALGGPHVVSNMQPAHPACNLAKGATWEESK